MTSQSIQQALTAASESDKMEFAHYLVGELAAFGLPGDAATARQVVAAFDRFAAHSPAHAVPGRGAEE